MNSRETTEHSGGSQETEPAQPAPPARGYADDWLRLQRTAGNRAVVGLLARSNGKTRVPPGYEGPFPPKRPLGEILDDLSKRYLKAIGADDLIRKRKQTVMSEWLGRITRGEDRLVKVINADFAKRGKASGYITYESAVRRCKTVEELEDAMGFARGYLGDEAVIQKLNTLPKAHQFELRGWTYLHPGRHKSYTHSQIGQPQWQLTEELPAKEIGRIKRKPPPWAGRGVERGGTTLLKPRGGWWRGTRLLKVAASLLDVASLGVDIALTVLGRRLSEQEEANTRDIWQSRIGDRIEAPLRDRIAELEEQRPSHPVRWVITWRLVTREIAEDFSDILYWTQGFNPLTDFGPGFRELVEDIRFDPERGVNEWDGARPWRSNDKPRVLGEERKDGAKLRIRGPMHTQILIGDPTVWDLLDDVEAGTGGPPLLYARYGKLSTEQKQLLTSLSPAFANDARAGLRAQAEQAAREKQRLEDVRNEVQQRGGKPTSAYDVSSSGERHYY